MGGSLRRGAHFVGAWLLIIGYINGKVVMCL